MNILKRFLRVVLFPVYFPAMLVGFILIALLIVLASIPVYIITGRDLFTEVGW